MAFGLLGVVWALSVPPMSGPDESAHVVKAVGVAHGDLRTSVTWADAAFGLRIPLTRVEVPAGYDLDPLTRRSYCWGTADSVPDNCLRDLAGESGPEVETQTYVGTYQPVYYAAVGWPSWLLPPDSGVLAARIVSALIVAGLLASALTSAAAGGGAFTVAATFLAIPPALVYLLGVVNPSAIEIAASVALWTSLLALAADPRGPRRVVLRSAVAAVCLIGVRPLSPAIAVAIVGVLAVMAADRTWLKAVWARRSVRVATVGVLFAWIASAAFVLATDATSSIIVALDPDQVPLLTAVRDAIGNSGVVAREQVGLLGPLGISSQRTPEPFVYAWLVAIGALVAGALAVGTVRRRIGLALIVVGSAATPVAASVVHPEAIWLGRYSLPLAVGIPLVAGWTIDHAKRVPARAASSILVGVSLLVAAVHLIDYRGLVIRNLFDLAPEVSAELNSQLWDGPLTTGAVRIVAFVASLAVAAAGILWAVVLAADARDDDPSDEVAGPRRDRPVGMTMSRSTSS